MGERQRSMKSKISSLFFILSQRGNSLRCTCGSQVQLGVFHAAEITFYF